MNAPAPWTNALLQEAFELAEAVHDDLDRSDETRNARCQLQVAMRALEDADTSIDLLPAALQPEGRAA